MAKPTIVTRAGKGSALTWTEGDTNLTNLRDATIGITDGTTSGTLDLNDTLTFTAGTNVTLSYNATSKALTINASGGSSTPTQVDFQSTPASTDVYFTMTSATGAGAKNLYAPATGGLKYNTGSGIITTDVNLTLNGSNLMVRTQGNIRLYDADDSHSIILSAPSNLTSNVNMTFPTTNGSNGQVLQTDGSGNLSWATPSSGGTPAGSNQQIQFNNNGAFGASSGLYYDGTSLRVTSGNIESLYSNGDEGGEIRLATATTNTTLAGGSVAIDIYQNRLRIFETGGSTRGVYLDLAGTDNTVGSALAVQGKSASFTTLSASTITLDDVRETVYTGGATTGTITPDCANGTIQKITLTGSITFNAFANPVAGQSLTLIITQSAAGNLTLTSTMKFANGIKTLSTAANSIDILNVFYDGTNYYASLSRGFA